jgi:putative hydrolase of the HAD superfamily
MKIRAIFWDIGGVLVRTVDRGPRTRLAQELGLTYAQLEEAVFNTETGQMGQIGKVSVDEVWRKFARTYRQPEWRIPEMQEAFFGGDVLDRDLVAEIRLLRQTYLTGIISNYFDNARFMLTNVWRIADVFQHVVISSEVGVVKPDERIYRLALEGLGVAAREAVFIDDFQHNVEGARRVGMWAIQFRSPEQALQELRELLMGESQRK